MIPQDESVANALIYLDAELSDNGQSGTVDPHTDDYIVQITPYYLDLNQFSNAQTTAFFG